MHAINTPFYPPLLDLSRVFLRSTTIKRETLTLILLALVFGTEASTVWKLWLRQNDLSPYVC